MSASRRHQGTRDSLQIKITKGSTQERNNLLFVDFIKPRNDLIQF